MDMVKTVKSWFGGGGDKSSSEQEHDDFIQRVDDAHDEQLARIRRIQATTKRFDIAAQQDGDGG